jgi:hypothetical protein
MTREEAIAVLESDAEYMYSQDSPYNREAYQMAVEALKAEPIKHTYVIVDEDGNMECSNCGSSNCYDNYCGNCGAKLIGERKDEVDNG